MVEAGRPVLPTCVQGTPPTGNLGQAARVDVRTQPNTVPATRLITVCAPQPLLTSPFWQVSRATFHLARSFLDATKRLA